MVGMEVLGEKVMEAVFWMRVVAVLFMLPVVVALPILYGIYFAVIRKKTGWRRNPFDWPDLLTPFAIGILWQPFSFGPKSLTNLAFESFMLGVAWCVAWGIRFWRFSRISDDKRKVSWVMLGIMCVAVVVVAALMPCMPE